MPHYKRTAREDSPSLCLNHFKPYLSVLKTAEQSAEGVVSAGIPAALIAAGITASIITAVAAAVIAAVRAAAGVCFGNRFIKRQLNRSFFSVPADDKGHRITRRFIRNDCFDLSGSFYFRPVDRYNAVALA